MFNVPISSLKNVDLVRCRKEDSILVNTLLSIITNIITIIKSINT